MNPDARQERLLERYESSLSPVFGRPSRVLVRGRGARVQDVEGREYVDLLAGIAVNALGHAHPDLVAALTDQVGQLLHVSNFFTTEPQIELAERLLSVAGAPAGSAVFFANSGTEAIEAAVKLARRTGRPDIVVADGAFHGRSTGALALTSKAAYREPFEPLLPGIRRMPYGDSAALARLLADGGDRVGAVVLEPIQGEAGVVVPPEEYLPQVRRLTREAGVLLVLDEVQTGIGRTGTWFAHQRAGIVPDAMTLAKGLAGGVPIGALVTYGEEVTSLLGVGQHGSTFGGNPLAARAGLTVLDVIARDGLVERSARLGSEIARRIEDLRDTRITEVRGRGLLLGIELTHPWAGDVVTAAAEAGYLVNAATPRTVRLAPPLVIEEDDVFGFVESLPHLLDVAQEAASASVPRSPESVAASERGE